MPEADYRQDAALENWPHIPRMYRLFEDKRPIMLYDIQEQRVYAHPYLEFKTELSERSQRSLKQQYEQAVRDGQIFVVRDNERQRLRSCSLDPG